MLPDKDRLFLGSFFLCFAYLQLFSAQNVRRYSFILGCIIFGRMFYVIQQVVAFVSFAKQGGLGFADGNESPVNQKRVYSR